MFAYDYPILGVFWTMVWLFLWIAWIFLLFRVIADLFRSHDMGGWAKALWAIFVVLAPFLGVFIYLIVRGHSMAERDVQQAQHQEARVPVVRPGRGRLRRRDRRRAGQARRPAGAGRAHRRRVRGPEGQAARLTSGPDRPARGPATVRSDPAADRPSTASSRVATPSLRYTFCTWDLRVLSDTYSAAAISR